MRQSLSLLHVSPAPFSCCLIRRQPSLLLFGLLALLFLSGNLPAQNFARGHYIARDGNRHDGLVAFQIGQDYFLFQTDKNAEAVRLKPEDALSFAWGAQTFFVRADRFARPIVDKGAARLYVHSKSGRDPGLKQVTGEFRPAREYFIQTYLLDRAGEGEVIILETKKKKFIPQMKAFFADAPGLVRRIEAKEFEPGDIERLVRIYNTEYADGNEE